MKNYGMLVRPLYELLKKDKWEWSDSIIAIFEALKLPMSPTSVLAFHDFSKEFIVETDASGYGIGVILIQGSDPLAYMSKDFSDAYLSMQDCEK